LVFSSLSFADDGEQAHLKALHEGGEITPEEIVEAHGEGIANIEKSVGSSWLLAVVGAFRYLTPLRSFTKSMV
jgi:hypothetical protein